MITNDLFLDWVVIRISFRCIHRHRMDPRVLVLRFCIVLDQWAKLATCLCVEVNAGCITMVLVLLCAMLDIRLGLMTSTN